MKNYKYGRLYWFKINCPDIDRFVLVRLLRKFGLCYIPFRLRFARRLFLREDQSKHAQLLINHCRRHGVETYVVQEGMGASTMGHNPLRADYYFAIRGSTDLWVKSGMDRSRIREYTPQKNPDEYSGIVFLHPLYTAGEDFINPAYWDGKNAKVMDVIHKFLMEDVVFKLHPKNIELVRAFIPYNRIVNGSVKELADRYKNIFCFSDSSVSLDLKLLNREFKYV